MTRALLVTADPLLLEELVRLAAAAGATPEQAADAGAALRAWPRAAVVLVGADRIDDLARLGPPRREGVYAVCWGPPDEALFRPALSLGARSVLELPAAAALVGELLADLDDVASARGLTVGVIGGSGGAGATVFTAALGQLAARTGSVLVLDADPLGPGLDRVLGLETAPGVRWGELAATSGRLGARSLRDALPRSGGLSVLTWERGSAAAPEPEVTRAVLAAARRGHDLVVVDLPRVMDAGAEELAARCDLLLVVVNGSVPGVASALRLLDRLGDRERLLAVVRGGADAEAVGRALGVPVLTAMADQRGLDEAIDLGLGPMRSRRGPLGRAAARVLERCLLQAVAA